MAESPSISAPPAPTANPLVVTDAGDKGSPLEGAGIVQDFGDAFLKCSDGSWTEGLANGVIGMTGLMEAVRDPLAALAGAGIGWLIEHVSFLSEPLDWLTGDQDTLENMAGTWGKIGDEIAKVSEDLDSDVRNDSAHWTGGGADAYRAFAKDRADTYAGIAIGSQAVGVLITISRTILNIIRSVVRDLIAECVGKLISMALRYYGPAVVVGVIAEGVPIAVKWSKKIIDKIKQLMKAFENGKGLFKELGGMFENAKQALRASETVQKIPKSLQHELYKEVGKKVGEKGDEALSGKGESDKPQGVAAPPIFEQPGDRRISGTL